MAFRLAEIVFRQTNKINKPMTSNKNNINFWVIWNLCFGFAGIQFGFALQNANVSRIFQTLGASIEDIPLLWIAGPVTGLLVQPLIGYLSDKSKSRLGRRRPYILTGALCASMALFFMPNSPSLWEAAITLWILDASLNATLGPSLALVGDSLPQNKRASGFAMQSFFIGIAAVIASTLPWVFSNILGVSNVAEDGAIPLSVCYSFYSGGALLLLCLTWTSIKSQERPFTNTIEKKISPPITVLTSIDLLKRSAALCLSSAFIGLFLIFLFNLNPRLYILAGSFLFLGFLLLFAVQLRRTNKVDNAIVQITNDLLVMPKIMRQLAVVQFFSWFAMFSFWVYATPAITSFHYQTLDTSSHAYSDGADWVGILFSIYNATAAAYAFILPRLLTFLSRKLVHSINLLLGAGALISFMFVSSPQSLFWLMIPLGCCWCSILALPHAILSCAVPQHKMGVYAGLFNFFIVSPQILASSLLGVVLMQYFANQTIWAMILGGFSLILAALFSLRVDEDQPATSQESDQFHAASLKSAN